MRAYLFTVFLLLTTSLLAIDKSQRSFNSELKSKLAYELGCLEVSMFAAKSEIAQLEQDKVIIDTNLKNMVQWGKNEEQQKNEYYTRTIEANQQIADVQVRVDLEKEKGKATLLHYRRVKSLLGYIFGIFLAFLYIQIGAPTVSLLLTALTGPWAFVVRFLGPVAVFGIGYATINIIF
jgi:hypothetical protein